MTFSSGNPAVDRYIAEGYETVRGMSSAFAATICSHIIRRQTEVGIKGHIAEIGTFEGRFFIAIALGLAEGERALGIDTFSWPNDGLLDLFHSHCARLGLARERYTAIKANARDLSPSDIRKALGGQEPAVQTSEQKVRFWHLDGDHYPTGSLGGSLPGDPRHLDAHFGWSGGASGRDRSPVDR